MIKNVSRIRENHLVTASLLQIEPELRIDMVNNELVDLLVELPGDGASFYIVTWPSRDLSASDFVDYIVTLKNHIEAISGRPLMIAWFDEQQGLFQDTLVEWMFGEYKFNPTPQPKLLDFNSKCGFFDYIRKQDSVIRLLKDGNLKVIKKIILSEDRNNIRCNAQMVYLRDFTPEYKMNPKPVQSYQERFDRNLNGQPQDEYPHDLLDDSILKAIRTVYPNADVVNSLLVTNTEYRALLRYKNLQKDYAEFRFFPDVSQIPAELYPQIGNIEGARFALDIYMHVRPNKNAFANEGFELRFPLQGWFDTLSQIVKELNTMHRVSEIIK